MFPSEWLKGQDLLDPNGEPKRVTVQIHHVASEKGTDFRTQQEIDKWNLYFVGAEKKLTLNLTNANRLAEMFTDNSDAWANQWIVIYPTLKNIKGKDIWIIDIHNKPGVAPVSVGATSAAPVAVDPSQSTATQIIQPEPDVTADQQASIDASNAPF